MSYTKRQYVIAAFEEIGLASYVFDLTNNELLSACKRLDAMMAQWNAKGIRKAWRYDQDPFMPIPVDPLTTGGDGVLDLTS
jgi:hypothetical protein